ncbi:MAG TPA: hypothetical protein VFN53_13570 [Acidobacteriaceae bacterium]|nr:hypothetical protein [Acidobacteriaceae bacterium]
MNSATAAGFLGGPVTSVVLPAGKGSQDVTCDFVSQHSKVQSILKIVVTTMSHPRQEFESYERQCGPNAVPLIAIGNEAIECAAETNGERSVRAIGRVRNRAFVVTVNNLLSNGVAASQNEQMEKTRHVAEQVSEALF